MSRVPINNNTFSSIKIRENINSGTDKITINASNIIDGGYTLTLPPNDGNVDQVLSTNGSGILSWEDQSGGGGNSVLITGDQTISGTKTFNSTIIGSISGNASTVTKGIYTTSSVADLSDISSSGSGQIITSAERTKLTNFNASDLNGSITNNQLQKNSITINSTSVALGGSITTPDTNTQLSDEQVQDIVGAMFTGNTETDISASYQDSDGTIDLIVGTLNQDTTGNASTATALKTARTIGGVSFDGTANITLPGVNSAGNQDTTGNASTATKIASITNNNIVQLTNTQTLTNKTLTTVPSLGFTENITFTPSANTLKLSGLSSGGLTCDGDITAFKSSDKRLKDNIVKIENPIEKIKKIGGYNFKWNKLGEKNTINKGKDIGLIAQEIEDVFPEATTTRDNGYKAVQYEKMIPLLVECIKEHQNMIENLQGQVDKLKIR